MFESLDDLRPKYGAPLHIIVFLFFSQMERNSISYHNELDWNVYTCLTQPYDGRDMYIIYYIKNKYMFRHFSLDIFRLINKKNVLSSYTRLVWFVYSGEVRGEVVTRSRMCCVGWVVWVHGFCYFCCSRLI